MSLKINEFKIAVIGCGNMASSLVLGIHRAYPGILFKTYTPTYTRAEQLAHKVQGIAVKDLKDLKDCDLLFIGCKPQQFRDLSVKLRDACLDHHHLVSMMAGFSMDKIKTELPQALVTRIMPNTPVKIGKGISLLFHDKDVQRQVGQALHDMFSSCSLVQETKSEQALDDITTISGCGPAYIFFFAKCLSDELEKFGLNQKEAKDLITELFLGTSLLLANDKNRSFDELIASVTSKGGVTIEAIKTFQSAGMSDMVEQAIKAAVEKTSMMMDSL